MSLSAKLAKIAKSNKYSSKLSDSKSANHDMLCTTDIPVLNVALSGDINGGMHAGVLQIVGDSRCFKTCYGLKLMSEYLKQNEDSYALFFDSEHGASFEYFEMFDIDKSKVFHLPIVDVEDLKTQAAQYLKEIEKGEKVFFFIDSLGLLPSRKEVEDAENEKHVADMTRAKAMNSFWRIVTNQINLKDLPLVAINHYYDTMAMYPEKIIKGGKGGFLASNDIWLVTRSKVKDGTDLAGWSFNIKIMKSRRVKENSRIPVVVTYAGGIAKYSGLLDIALLTGDVVKPKNGWYTRPAVEGDKSWRQKDLDGDFWAPILSREDFQEKIRQMYLTNSGGSIDNKISAFMDESDNDYIDSDV